MLYIIFIATFVAILLCIATYVWVKEKDYKKGTALLISALVLGAGGIAGEDVLFPQTPSYTIDGNTVFINDSKAYLSATPHTLAGDGWVEVELGTKQFTGDINVLFGFDTEQVTPTQLQR